MSIQACCSVRNDGTGFFECRETTPCECIRPSSTDFLSGTPMGPGTLCSHYCNDLQGRPLLNGCTYCGALYGACCIGGSNSRCQVMQSLSPCADVGGIWYARSSCAQIPNRCVEGVGPDHIVGCCFSTSFGFECRDVRAEECVIGNGGLFNLNETPIGQGGGKKSYLCKDMNLLGSVCRSTNSFKQACCRGDDCTFEYELDCCVNNRGFAGPDDSDCNTHDCTVPPPPSECRFPLDDIDVPNRLGWSTNFCNPVFFMPYIRAENEYPINDPDFEPGFVEFSSMHPVRAMDLDSDARNAGDEVCAYHMARPTYDDGYFKLIYCSQYAYGINASRESHWANAYFQVDDLSSVVEQGGLCFVGSYHAREWHELQYFSNKRLCGVIPQ